MKNLVNRAQMALKGEGGGPSVEQVLGIAFALIIAAAIFAFGDQIMTWITNAGDTVGGWAGGGELSKDNNYQKS